MIQYHIFDIRDNYRSVFRRFFHTDPLSLRGHVTDAANLYLVISLLRRLNVGAEPCEAFNFSEEVSEPWNRDCF